MSDQTANPDTAALLADGRPIIRCGCGFLAVSADQQQNRWALEEHPCPLGEDGGSRSWASYVFSLWGVLIVVIVLSAVVAMTGHTW